MPQQDQQDVLNDSGEVMMDIEIVAALRPATETGQFRELGSLCWGS